MHFQVTVLPQKAQQTVDNSVPCITWVSNDEFYSCGGDHTIYRWNSQGGEVVKIAELSKDFTPTSLHNLQKSRSNKPGSDLLLLLTTSNGKIMMMSGSGRLEKCVDAHKSEILVAKISKDGSSILTGSEDGSIKIWSRSAMLRASFNESTPSSIIAADWSPDSQAIAYAQGASVIMKPLIPGLAPTKWQAHEGMILSLSWSPTQNGFIATGGEDGKCKVWDSMGHLMFSSSNQGSPVTCLAWNLNGQILAVSSHNALRLCQTMGRFSTSELVSNNTAHAINWNKDNSRLIGACGSGKIISANIVGREIQRDGIQAKMVGDKIVQMRDLKISDMWETLEVKSSILLLEAGHGHVVLATSDRCLIYNMTTINTPMEIKVAGVFLLQITAKCILAVNEFGFWVYSLQGRAITVPQVPNLQNVHLTENTIHLAPDHLAIRDSTEFRVVHVLDFGFSRATDSQGSPKIRFKEPIKQVALNQTETERCLAALDLQGDLYVVPNPALQGAASYKISGMVRHIMWNSCNPYLSALTESELIVWFYPQIVVLDNQLVTNTRFEKDLSEIGTNAILTQFSGGLLEIQRHDKMKICMPMNLVPATLFSLTEKGDWVKAMKLVRKASSTSLCKPGSMHSFFAARCLMKNQPKKSLPSYIALGMVDEIEYVMSQNR
ncbi:intraflagellar transport protein 80 homolog [Neocloeon triangulifer]|uniref:intraflagellar transport protein 80 homolog n=1 Tax=Neocloeon triangulifer TaxID=2078957 RepID=UPI00286F580E|nr:intraflagellar transport protein 80 homolog [Neocloeon triangulifer]